MCLINLMYPKLMEKKRSKVGRLQMASDESTMVSSHDTIYNSSDLLPIQLPNRFKKIVQRKTGQMAEPNLAVRTASCTYTAVVYPG